MLKTCSTCGQVKEHYESERGNTCKDCKKDQRKARYQLQKEQERERHLSVKYGISQEVYNHMYDLQKGACKICRKNFPKLHVDHCHETGNVRGLLCGSCNRGLGLLQDDITNLTYAITYLESSRNCRSSDEDSSAAA